MTDQINTPNSKNKLSFLQLIIPVLLALMVFLLSIIVWFGQTNYSESNEVRKTQQHINLQVLENLGTLNANCDVNITELIAFHNAQGTLATLTAVQPPGRFGAFQLGHDEYKVPSFQEKPDGDGAWINSGFFVLEPGVMDYIEADSTVWEKDPLERLASEGQLTAFRHHGFWQPMYTLRDKRVLDDLWESGQAPWKNWE